MTEAKPPKRVDLRKGDRHSPGYRRDWMRKKRAAAKAKPE